MREFLWSEDMADACVYIMEKRNFEDCYTNPNHIVNTHINIGTGIDISIKDLAYLIKEIVGYDGDFVFNTEKPDGTLKKLTDCSKLNNLGWKHKIDLAEGIKKMYLWYLQNK
jgi:GDP-L-fucose synthase